MNNTPFDNALADLVAYVELAAGGEPHLNEVAVLVKAMIDEPFSVGDRSTWKLTHKTARHRARKRVHKRMLEEKTTPSKDFRLWLES